MAALKKPGRDAWIAFGVLLGWNLLLFHRVLFLGEVPDGGDQNYLHYPWKTFFLNSLREGVFPFWNPYPFCGTPFFADIQTCTLYPPDWIYFFVPLPWGFGLSYFLHSFAAGLFFYSLSGRFLQVPRARVLSALVYSGAGALVSRLYLGNAVVIASYAWAPLFFLCAMRAFDAPSGKRIGLLAIVSAFFILAGHPQIPFLTVQLLFAYLVYVSWVALAKRRQPGCRATNEIRPSPVRIGTGWLAVAAGGLLGLGMTIVQVGPFLELAGYSASRAGGASYEFAAEGSMPVPHLLTLFLPFFFGDPTTQTYWGSLIPFPEICGYVGSIPLLLILAARLMRGRDCSFWLVVAVVGVLLALGEFTIVHRVFYAIVPGWDLFRQPGRSLFLFAFAGCVLAGIGFEALDRGVDKAKPNAYPTLGFAVGPIILLLVGGFAYLATHKSEILDRFAEIENQKSAVQSTIRQGPYVPENFTHRYEWMERSVLEPIIYLSGLAGALVGWRRRPEKRAQIGWILIGLVGLDLYRFGHRFLATMPEDEWRELRHPRSELAAQLSEDADLGRLLQPDTALDYRFRERHPELYPNGPMAQGIRTVRGYSATILAPYSRFINTIQGRDPEELPGGLLILDNIDDADLLGLQILGIRRMIDYRPHPDPFVSIEKGRDGLYVHELEGFLPRCFRAIPSDNRWGLAPVERSRDRTSIVASNPNRIVVRTSGKEPAELVFSDCRYPGWRASLDGKDVPITEAFMAFQRVSVPEGESTVAWEFRPTRFGAYALLSALSWIACLFLLVVPIRRFSPGCVGGATARGNESPR
jgi:hypothetical protein